MNFHELVNKRQSVRKYSSQKVNDELILKCIESARLAPSANNSQPWHFIIVNNTDLKLKVAKATITQKLINSFTLQASALVVIVVEKPTTLTRFAGWVKKRDFEWTDLGIAAEHFCLQAVEFGLGTCIIGWFDEKKIMELLNIPKNKRVGLVISIGYPAENYVLRKKTRKPLNQILTLNKY